MGNSRIRPATWLALLLCMAAAPTRAQFVGENLLVTVPSSFKLGYEGSRPDMNMQEWIPSNETVENWSEMVTIQVFLQATGLDPVQSLVTLQKLWVGACKGGTVTSATTSKTSGYAAATTLLRCPLLASSGKPETTMVKAIKGNDSFYVVQTAARSVPDEASLAQMKQYLEKVSVCDSRLPARPCPNLGGPK